MATSTKEYWCDTCGKTISYTRWTKYGDCKECEKWWLNNPPPEDEADKEDRALAKRISATPTYRR